MTVTDPNPSIIGKARHPHYRVCNIDDTISSYTVSLIFFITHHNGIRRQPLSTLAIQAPNDSRLRERTQETRSKHTICAGPGAPLAHTGEGWRVSSFVTLQLTQKLDANGILVARGDWTIGHSCLCCRGCYCTVRSLKYMSNERVRVVCGLHASKAAASACCTSCRSAWATHAGQEERRRAVVKLTPTVH